MATLPSPVKKIKPDGGLRALAAKYFPGLEDKILYLINGESGGNAQAVGDGGAAYGLFQSHYIKPGTSVEDQFKDARRLYDARVRAGGSGFEDWGENNLFEGKKFGALGNNPYPGDSNEGRTIAGPYNPRGHVDQDWHYGDSPGKPKVSAPAKLPNVVRPGDADSGLGGTAAGYRNSAEQPKKKQIVAPRPPAYVATGRYDDDMNGYSAAEQTALDKLDGIQDRIIRVNANGTAEAFKGFIATDGNFYEDPSEMPDGVSPDVDSQGQPKEVWVLDPEASQYARDADSAHKAQLRLDARRKAGLLQSTDDAAKAYVAAGTAEATGKYNDYTTRMKDLVALEDLPTARAMSLGNALDAANKANSARENPYGQKLSIKAPAYTDMSPFAAAIKSTIPATAPQPFTDYPANKRPSMPPPGKVQLPPPESLIPGRPQSLQPELDPSQLPQY